MGKTVKFFTERINRTGFMPFVLFVAGWLVFSAQPVYAHRMTIFAWVEGDVVHTESKFGNGKAVKHAKVSVSDVNGNFIIEGKTDEDGRYFFKAPKPIDLKIVLTASMGHQAEWTVSADEFMQGPGKDNQPAPKTDGTPEKEEVQKKQNITQERRPADATMTVSSQEIKEMIDSALDRKFKPVMDMLVKLNDPSPKMSDVVGGIGYIFGLAGVYLYFSSRKRKDR
jgi:nickel transport protein